MYRKLCNFYYEIISNFNLCANNICTGIQKYTNNNMCDHIVDDMYCLIS